MQQVKKPKKPLIFYYVLVLLVMFVLNTFVVPGFLKASDQGSRLWYVPDHAG